MSHEIWKKQGHQRKNWDEKTIFQKYWYYLQPLGKFFINTIMQPLPFASIFKVYSGIIILFLILVPILHFVVACLITYGVFQYFVESTFETKFPRSWNLLDLVKYIYNFEVKNPHQQYFVNLYFARWRVMITAITSSLDYLRLTFCLLNELFE
ncbi:uncharacterized protein LOC119684400 isoform X2 [Teleopsis dalmanni]|uniref:uncharacterized protein LOC119684400 isoform X2 n=1 Tax=Teleopsis dalmanni TaxID=139649 RepID=UPI0018CD49B8|nr:uncharacterized protein LOC119684400 isoform X2 [Teleopsis dalmanni]